MAKKIKVEKDLSNELLKDNKKSIKKSIPTTTIKFKLDDRAELPRYAIDGDAGMDVKAIDVEYDDETDTYIYHTGVAYESEKGIVSFGLPRSSNCKTDCYLTNGIGTIDCAVYRGYIQFRYKNRTSLESRVIESALLRMTTIPWYKKMFMSSDRLMLEYGKAWAEQYEYHIKHAMDYAPYKIGDRIGQITFVNFLTIKPEIVEELSKTERGKGGFGHTGK